MPTGPWALQLHGAPWFLISGASLSEAAPSCSNHLKAFAAHQKVEVVDYQLKRVSSHFCSLCWAQSHLPRSKSTLHKAWSRPSFISTAHHPHAGNSAGSSFTFSSSLPIGSRIHRAITPCPLPE